MELTVVQYHIGGEFGGQLSRKMANLNPLHIVDPHGVGIILSPFSMTTCTGLMSTNRVGRLSNDDYNLSRRDTPTVVSHPDDFRISIQISHMRDIGPTTTDFNSPIRPTRMKPLPLLSTY